MNRPKIGGALGSGGARGLAHIGVLRVLEENNIPIDYLAGASIGSIVGAYYSINRNIASLEKKVSQLTNKDFLKLIDFTYPKQSLLRGNKIKNFINRLIEKKSFSDTKIPFKIVTTDLCSGEEVQINKGNLIDSIMASISLPAILPPVKINNRLLIDGGVINPTPVDVVKKMGADIIIGVDLIMKHPIKLKNPNILETLMHSFEIIRMQNIQAHISNVKDAIIIKPSFAGNLDLYRFDKFQRFIEEGKRVAIKALPKIKELINRRRTK